MRKFLDRGIAILMAMLVAIVILGVAYLFSTMPDETTMISHNGVVYKCYHYPNEMECVSVDDPDVGGGRIQP